MISIQKLVCFILILLFGRSINAQFVEKSTELKIDHFHLSALLMGGGATFFDLDADGFLDLYTTGGGKSDKLYLNLADGSFHDLSKQSNIDDLTKDRLTTAVISGDVDNDGCSDLFITTFDNTPNILLINNCDGTFQDVSDLAGILDISASMGATFIDVNNDGNLDIYVINYVKKSKDIKDIDGNTVGFEHECYPNYLYMNQGDGKFKEEAVNYSVDNIGCGLAVASTDIDNDGITDIYIANDFGEWVVPNTAYINNYPSKDFQDISIQANLDVELYAMGIAVGDYDNDNLSDFYISNLGRNSLLNNNESNSFLDKATSSEVENTMTSDGKNSTSWGTFFFDYDNDTDLDLYVANGFIGSAPFLNTAQEDPNKLYRNDGNGNFTDVSSEANVASILKNRGAIYGDYDNDGDLDVFCVTINGDEDADAHSLFYENIVGSEKGWVEFILEGTIINKDAFGTVIKLYADGKSYLRELYGGGTHTSQSSKILHFGLNEIRKIDSIQVKWGASKFDMYYDIPINQKIYLKEGVDEFEIVGCMDTNNQFYNEMATFSSGCFKKRKIGCTDSTALNYDENAEIDDGNCKFMSPITQLNNDFDGAFRIYPNYFANFINVDFENDKFQYVISLFNSEGRKLNQMMNQKQKNLFIDTSELKAGIYFLSIRLDKSNEELKTFKLIKL